MSEWQAEETKLGRAFDREQLMRLLRFAKPHGKIFAVVIGILFANFGLALLGPYLIRASIDGPIAAVIMQGRVISEVLPQLLQFIAFYSLVSIGSGVFEYYELLLMTRAGQNVIYDIRMALFSHLQKLSLPFYDRNPVGALVTRVTSDVENLAELFTSGILIFVFDLTKIVVIVGILFWINTTLALVILAFAPVLIIGASFFRHLARNAYRQVRLHLARLNGYLQEALAGIRIVQVFRQEAKVAKKFAAINADYLHANIRSVFFFSVLFPSVDFLIYASAGAFLLFSGTALLANEMTYGMAIQFYLYLQMLFEPIRQLGEKYNILQSAMASSERIFKIIDTPSSILIPPTPKKIESLQGAIRFRSVHFSYNPGIPVLKGISLHVKPGEKIALVGATGSGKTTILSLLARYYDPTAGSIEIDGVDLREVDPGEVRAQIGFVPQDVFLFAGTIEENISLNRQGIDQDKVITASRYAQADSFIQKLPKDYQAEVMERGVTFSMGERQLLAYARALAGDPPIVVLDEATANIDTETEMKIQEATHKILQGRTAIIVAHRLSTVREVDRILVLHKGELAEEGNHRQLLRKGGIYAKLHRLQFAV